MPCLPTPSTDISAADSSAGAPRPPEDELSAAKLRQVFDEVLFSPGRLQAMEEGALALARPDAADAVLDLAVELKLERCRSRFASS